MGQAKAGDGRTTIDLPRPAAPAGATTLVLRPLEGADADGVARLDRRLTGRTTRPDQIRTALEAARLQSGVELALVAELEGQVVGYLLAALDRVGCGAMDAVAVVQAVGVDPSLRRRGVGKALLAELRRQLQAVHVERVRAEIDWREGELLRLVERSGFRHAPRICVEAAVEDLPRLPEEGARA